MSSVGKINISLTILVVFESTRFTKTFNDFLNDTFPVDTDIINLFHYKCLTSMTVLKYDDVIKKSRDLDYYFSVF